MVTKEFLLAEIKKSATAEAKAQSLSQEKINSMYELGEELIDNVFFSLILTKVTNSTIESQDPLEEWHYRETNEAIENDWKLLTINRNQLIYAAEQYLSTKWMHNKYLDWLFLNILIYAEYQAFIDFTLGAILPTDDYIKQKCNQKIIPISLEIKPRLSFVEITVWLTVFLISLISKYTAIAWISYTIWYKWKSQKKLKEANERIKKIQISMLRTYACTRTISNSWEVIWDELNQSRVCGAVWDGVLYRLVEERRK